jgi:hypothetical protein
MSTTTGTRADAQASSLAKSATFKTFAVAFAIATPVIYVICETRNWPLFTYHPGTNRLDLFWAAAVRNEGPAMHWYGWTANTLIGAAVIGGLATMLPERLTRRIPLSLVWIVPLAAVPVLIYALKFFWRW